MELSLTERVEKQNKLTRLQDFAEKIVKLKMLRENTNDRKGKAERLSKSLMQKTPCTIKSFKSAREFKKSC